MKRIAYRFSIVLPLLMIFAVLLEMPTLTITELGLYLDRYDVLFLYIAISVLWLCCSPFRRSCCVGDRAELLFNLVPIEIISAICLAQYHFILTVILLALMVAIQCAFAWSMRKEEQQHEFSEKRHRRYICGLQRCSILISAIIFAIPCVVSIFVYGLKSPTYAAEERLWEILFGDENEETAVVEEEADPYVENKTLLLYFDDTTWDTLNIRERITVAQEFVDFQSQLLGIPTIPVTAEKLGAFTLGEYSNLSNEMWIDMEYLATSEPEDTISTLAHEVFHSCQHYLVNNIDWNVDVFQSTYFQELRDWKTNGEDYQQPYLNGYDAYADQPLEASARAYSIDETAKILSYIYLLKQEE